MADGLTSVDAADPPLWLIHGDSDPQMPFEQSKEFVKAYQNVGSPVKLEIVVGGKHGGEEFYSKERLTGLAKQVRAALDKSQSLR